MKIFTAGKTDFPAVKPFHFFVQEAETTDSPQTQLDHHIHPECEIYINLSGDVAFMVGDRVYAVEPGDVILSRPHEYHQCIYRGQTQHRHIWILFSCEGNEALFAPLLERSGRIVLTQENQRQLVAVCRALGDGTAEPLEQYRLFFKLTALLLSGTVPAAGGDAVLPVDVVRVMELIDRDIAAPLTVREMAAAVHLSVNTLERHFRQAMQISPSEYLQIKRLAAARELLAQGHSVQETCEICGFSDYSHFITLFRRHFGVTPLKYRKRM